MSKLLAQRGRDSGSDSENESEDDEKQVATQSRFAYFGSDSSSDDEKGPRNIRTAKDKEMDAFKSIVTNIKNHLRINDFTSIQDDFTNLTKLLDKFKQIIEKEGVPKIYYKALVLIEDTIKEMEESAKKAESDEKTEGEAVENKVKKLGTLQLKAFNTMRNKIKKHNRECAEELGEYRKNPLASEEEGEAEEEEEAKEKSKGKAKKPAKDEDDEEEDEDEDEDGESDEGESSEEDTHDRHKMTPQQRRLKVTFYSHADSG